MRDERVFRWDDPSDPRRKFTLRWGMPVHLDVVDVFLIRYFFPDCYMMGDMEFTEDEAHPLCNVCKFYHPFNPDSAVQEYMHLEDEGLAWVPYNRFDVIQPMLRIPGLALARADFDKMIAGEIEKMLVRVDAIKPPEPAMEATDQGATEPTAEAPAEAQSLERGNHE